MFSSQSPQTGQFNSYIDFEISLIEVDNFVSIPSNGSIQFLHISGYTVPIGKYEGLNPLKRVNSILTF